MHITSKYSNLNMIWLPEYLISVDREIPQNNAGFYFPLFHPLVKRGHLLDRPEFLFLIMSQNHPDNF
jgi:hypothetical protein